MEDLSDNVSVTALARCAVSDHQETRYYHEVVGWGGGPTYNEGSAESVFALS